MSVNNFTCDVLLIKIPQQCEELHVSGRAVAQDSELSGDLPGGKPPVRHRRREAVAQVNRGGVCGRSVNPPHAQVVGFFEI